MFASGLVVQSSFLQVVFHGGAISVSYVPNYAWHGMAWHGMAWHGMDYMNATAPPVSESGEEAWNAI